MKCIIKRMTCFFICTALLLPMAACGKEESLEEAYDVIDTSAKYNIGTDFFSASQLFTGSGAAVLSDEDVIAGVVNSSLSKAAILVNVDDSEVLYARSALEKLYPASITKLMTAYLVLNNVDDLDAELTISATAVALPEGSSRCGFSEGDKMTVRDCLYGLLLKSGNDAAVALAEYVSGSESEFVELMNETAKSFGASHTNFANSSGLHDDNHYTTAYDLYLIMNHLAENEEYKKIAADASYKAVYQNAEGEEVSANWQSTDLYLDNTYELPQGITILGGKTGTTSNAGSCLLLYTQNEEGKHFISIVLGADNKDNLYEEMSELLQLENN